MVKLFRQEKGRKKFLNKSLWKLHVIELLTVNFQGKERKEDKEVNADKND